MTTSLNSLGAKLFVVCAGPGKVSNLEVVNGAIVHFATYSKNLESYWFDLNLGIFAKGNSAAIYIITFHLG